jgi:hypothetical protein
MIQDLRAELHRTFLDRLEMTAHRLIHTIIRYIGKTNKLNMSTKTDYQEETAVEIETEVAEEGQTIVHCVCGQDAAYRIWPSTYLIEHGGNKKAKLITAFNISFYPYWTIKNRAQKFTLIFEGLSKSCAVFDLKEVIPQEGGFEVTSIVRNQTDVYTVNID